MNMITRDEVRLELSKLKREIPLVDYEVSWLGRRNYGQLGRGSLSEPGGEILSQGDNQKLFDHIQAMRDGVRGVKMLARVYGNLLVTDEDPRKWRASEKPNPFPD